MFVIGTAGHVDHGKSSLIRALTGMDPDRLREEQERGLTIELGFAWMTLPSGHEVSIVDVPGHVRFVRHMLTGIGAVDLALLVIAADEGVMPQTREHLDILDLLDVQHGIVVLTKCDLVDEEWLELVAEEVGEVLAGTALADAPLLQVSSATGYGMDDLRAAVDRTLDAVEEPSDIGRPRLGVDRVFTMSGFGTVVTGTLLDGRLRTGDQVEITPGRRTARIRGLQTHRREVDEAQPGTRVAVNLSGVDVEQIQRGQVIARAGRMSTVRAFDAAVRALPGRELRHNARVHVHIGAAEVQGRVRVLSGDVIGGDQTADGDNGGPARGWAQLVLSEPVAAVPGDLFVLRISDHTVGGGRIVEVNPPRHRRNDAATLERLDQRAAGTPESRVIGALERLEPTTADRLVAEVELDDTAVRTVIEALLADESVRALDTPTGGERLLVTAGGIERFAGQVADALLTFHRQHPLRFAMPREELRSQLRLPQREFAALLGSVTDRFRVDASAVVEPDWAPQPTAAQQREIDDIERALREAGSAPPRMQIEPEILAHLEGAGRVVDCGDQVVLSREAFDDARARVIAVLRSQETITLAEVRDLLETNRRATQAILETFDRTGVTRRHGDERVLHESMRTAE